ncbi:MAG: hypothetical protein WEG56_01350 [Chloroflexota bacterium]
MRILLGGTFVVVLLVGAAVVVAMSSAGPGAPVSSPDTTRAPGSGRTPEPPPPPGTTYRNFVYETEIITAPTATKAQSKMWFADGQWWAGLYQPTTNRLNIFRLEWDTQLWVDTGVLVDERATADPDFLWNGEYLYVVTAGTRPFAQDAGRILRFSYDPDAQRFELDKNFPITITTAGTSAIVIAQDSLGTLWVTYSSEGRIWVARSDGHDAQWLEPYPLPVRGATVQRDDIASVVAFGPGRIGIMWSNQLDHAIYFSVHRDSDPDDAWSPPEVVIDGLGSADDHINLKTYATGSGTIGVVAALKTSMETGTRINPLSPLILLAVRADDDTWRTHVAGLVRDRHTRPIVMVDEVAREFYLAATSPVRGGNIYYKRTPMDGIAFETGEGQILMTSAADVRINNASSTKQPLTRESGMVVLASDDDTGRYLHAVLDLGAGLPPSDPADPRRLDVPDPPDPASPVILVRNDFEPWPVGAAIGTVWRVRPEDPPTALTIVDDGDGGRALRVSAGADGVPVRSCREFSEVPEGSLAIEARLRFSRLGASDTALLSLRGSGGEAGNVRVTDAGFLAWYDGTVKVRTEAQLVSGRWYRVFITVDQTARTYDIRVTTDGGAPIASQSAIAWRSSEVRNVRSLCQQHADGAPGQALDISDVEIVQVPTP